MDFEAPDFFSRFFLRKSREWAERLMSAADPWRREENPMTQLSVSAPFSRASGVGDKRPAQPPHPAQVSVLYDHLDCAGRLDPRVIPGRNLIRRTRHVHRGLCRGKGPNQSLRCEFLCHALHLGQQIGRRSDPSRPDNIMEASIAIDTS